MMFFVIVVVSLVLIAVVINSIVAASRTRRELAEAEKETEAGSGCSWEGYDDGVRRRNVKRRYRCQVGTAAGGLVAVALLVALCSIYPQDAGEVIVLRNFGGSVAGLSKDAGFHIKAPWQETITYDARNNVISFVKDGEEDYTGGSANGPQVSVNDSGGASANIDIQVNYSLNPDYATDLYQDYGAQETFVRSVAAVDVRSVPREVAGQFDTITLLTNRSEFTQAVQEALTKKWEPLGLNVEQVSVQEIRYPSTITDKYDDAQAAEIAKQQAENEQETARVQAETKKIEAQGEADANQVLSQSLNDEVLMQHYIDKLGESEFIVVPQDGGTILDLGSLTSSK